MGFFSSIGNIVKKVAPAAIGFATGGIGTGLMSLAGTALANRANKQAAQTQMDFQQDMSSTAYQRSMADMRAAGLNPMLAYSQGGASTPSGASYSSMDYAQPAVSSALQARRLQADLGQIEAATHNIKTQSDLNDALQAKAMQEARRTIVETQNSAKQGMLLDAAIPKARNKAAVESGAIGKYGAYLDRIMDSIGGVTDSVKPFSGKSSKYTTFDHSINHYGGN